VTHYPGKLKEQNLEFTLHTIYHLQEPFFFGFCGFYGGFLGRLYFLVKKLLISLLRAV